MTAQFTPADGGVADVPVNDLRKSWRRASVLTAQSVPPEGRTPGERVEDHGFAFELEADLDRDGRADTLPHAVSGVCVLSHAFTNPSNYRRTSPAQVGPRGADDDAEKRRWP